MPTSVRVDEETEALLERAAHLTAVSKSAVIRTALKQYYTRISLSKVTSPYDSIKEWIGCVDGPPDLSRRARHHLRESLHAKAKRHSR